MKNLKVLYLFPLLVSVLAGCNKGDEVQTPVGDPNVISLFDFDGWGPGYQTIRLQNSFGKVSENYDLNYVKSGAGSALLQPVGNYLSNDRPTIYWPTISNVFGYNYSDFSYFQKFEFDMFNASNNDVNMTFGCVSGINSIKNVNYGKGEDYVLKAGEWQHIVYEPDISKLATYITITDVPGIYMAFDNQKDPDLNKAPKLYLDNVVLHKSSTKRDIKDLFHIKKYEICDFEDEAAYNHISVSNNGAEQLSIEVVGETGGVKPTSGKKMLHISNKNVGDRWVCWSYVMFSTAYLSKTDIGKLPESEVEAGKWGLRYNIYYAPHGNNFFQGNTFPKFIAGTGEDVYVPTENYAVDGWVTVTIPFNTDISYYGGSGHAIVRTNYITNCGSLGWTIGNEEYDMDIYIDNIKLVEIK